MQHTSNIGPSIVTPDTLRHARVLHWYLWNWQADHPLAGWYEWPGWDTNKNGSATYWNGYRVAVGSFMCNIYWDVGMGDCPGCPLDYLHTGHGCWDSRGLKRYYARAVSRRKKNKARRLAILIRDAWR